MKCDIAVVGGGVLGVTTAYWLNALYECSIALLDKENQICQHTTMRNTGIVHRPYYLDPDRKRVFALSAEESYPLWKDIASRFDLPWAQVGTLMVATEERQNKTLQQYIGWGATNGMDEEEFGLLDESEVRAEEPEVKCTGAIISRLDASSDYARLTRAVWSAAERNGARLLPRSEVRGVKAAEAGTTVTLGDDRSIVCSLLINAAGGGALDVAHMTGLGKEYTDLHFRGDYWTVDEARAPKVSRNVYSVPRHGEFPFLDPHFIIRADGRREVGPNAALVAAPDTYEGLGGAQLIAMMLERPILPKAKLFTNGTFLSLAWDEWRSSLSKDAMCNRVRRFLPSLETTMLTSRGLAGVRSSLIDRNGFVPEALLLEGDSSLHVLNYNSPGATGAPVFSAHVVRRLRERGFLDGFKEKRAGTPLWDFRATEIE
ncbi:MAG: FAD-dependent oxidoreductase [Nitrososphaerales archaeon]|nr:FAD-dependent oxidoreductase [Nitrososphaerales archaeon]